MTIGYVYSSCMYSFQIAPTMEITPLEGSLHTIDETALDISSIEEVETSFTGHGESLDEFCAATSTPIKPGCTTKSTSIKAAHKLKCKDCSYESIHSSYMRRHEQIIGYVINGKMSLLGEFE